MSIEFQSRGPYSIYSTLIVFKFGWMQKKININLRIKTKTQRLLDNFLMKFCYFSLWSWSDIIFWIIALVSVSDILSSSLLRDWEYVSKNSLFSFSNSFHTANQLIDQDNIHVNNILYLKSLWNAGFDNIWQYWERKILCYCTTNKTVYQTDEEWNSCSLRASKV